MFNLPKKYLIYMICCNVTHRKYIGSTSNLTSRLAVHLSTYKKQIVCVVLARYSRMITTIVSSLRII